MNIRYITRTIWILSLVSLFTDTASEMLYPVMPIYLKSIGFTVVLIGILEGVAEAAAGLSKGYFGNLSDNLGKRVPFVRIGYLLSAVSKPMMAVFIYPVWIFFARTVDRFGKGIRTGARDAILSHETTAENKGKVFGFHRGMDTLGAVLGPLSALLYLYYNPADYKNLFLIAFIPGAAAVLFTFFLKDKKNESAEYRKPIHFFSFLNYWKKSPKVYRKVVIGLLIFTLFNSSDVFLLLKLKETGITDASILGIYIFYNLVFAAFSLPAGIIADKFGLKKIFISGLALFAAVYTGMSFNTNFYLSSALFFLYGIYAAATEGISKAWISNITERKDTATAIGTYAGFQSICTMLASSIAGVIWFQFDFPAAFVTTAVVTVIVIVYFIAVIPEPNPERTA
ncbi:MAG TPA: MFS transporter [Ignavibacteriaceae bacterium]|nr:MFS transporter [Ignavibacteriaceae bacterium]